MILIGCIQLFIVACLVVAGRKSLENALPFFCFFLVLMPLEARLVIPGLFDFNTMRVSLLTLLGLFCIKHQPFPRFQMPLRRLMLLHVGWVVCSTLYSISVATSAKQLISQVLEYYLLYYLFVTIISTTQTLYSIIFAMMMAMALCCIFGLLEAYATWSILRIFPSNLWITYNGGVDPLYIEWGRGLRIRSTFPHPILFGDALAMSIPLSLFLLSIWEGWWQRALLWAGLILMIWAIYKTSSRGPWLGAGLCCALIFVLVQNRVRKYLVYMALICATIFAVRPGIWETIAGLYESTTDSTSPVGSSYLYRDALTHAITNAVARDPARALLGYGLGTFREIGLEIQFLDTVQRWYTCDNNWAAFLYETGYIGLLLISILLGKALFIAFQGYRKLLMPDNYLSGVLFASLTGFYFLLLSVAGYSWGQQGYMAWILISLSVSHSRVASLRKSGSDITTEPSHEVEEKYELHVV